MNNNRKLQETKYFSLRNSPQGGDPVGSAKLPKYITDLLSNDKHVRILDIGCGFGGLLFQFKQLGYQNLHGVDINDAAVNFCQEKSLDVTKIASIVEYCEAYTGPTFDLVIMTHVIEHIKKDEVIATLAAIKKILTPMSGKLYLTTPNAQSRSGCYWAYEDFTHELVFTAGSLYYVLSAAGYTTISYVDPKNIENSRFKLFKKIFLYLYTKNDLFWNKITGAAYHPTSPIIYSWELKITAK
jgi:2-polyprenyl-3-methyl-5-hydroxy-6-metoxy-1,4-benzoquinol methylase